MMLGQLNGKRPHATRARVDKNLLPALEMRSFDQHLPGGQADQGDGRRFFHSECFGLDRHVTLFDRDEFGERADSPVGRPRIDFVARLESPRSRSDADHHSGHVMAQNERKAIRQNELELAVSDSGIQKVHAGGVDLDQDGQREWFTQRLLEWTTAAGVKDAKATARALVVLFDGAVAGSEMDGPERARDARWMAKKLLAGSMSMARCTDKCGLETRGV